MQQGLQVGVVVAQLQLRADAVAAEGVHGADVVDRNVCERHRRVWVLHVPRVALGVEQVQDLRPRVSAEIRQDRLRLL